MKALDTILEKKVSVRDMLLGIGYFVSGYALSFLFIFSFILLSAGQNAILDIARISIQISGIILGFTFVAIAQILRLEKDMHILSLFFLKSLLEVLRNFIFVLILSLILIFIGYLPTNLILLTISNVPINSTIVLSLILTALMMSISFGFYSLFKLIKTVNKYLNLDELEEKINREVASKK